MAKPENIRKVAEALMLARARAGDPSALFALQQMQQANGQDVMPQHARGIETVAITAPPEGEPFGRPEWKDVPDRDVLATPEDDAAALKFSERINTNVGQGEMSVSQHRDGSVVRRPSLDDSISHCDRGDGVAFCLHSHPKISGDNTKRLVFGPGDNAPLLKHTLNYMLNAKRDLFALEYKKGAGYQRRYIGNVPLWGR